MEDYEVLVPEELLAQAQRTQQIFNVIMGSIAGISLLVGGIGIMNIMLANVSERTREIGIRRAIGATKGDILVQFIIETVLICLTGGCPRNLLGVWHGEDDHALRQMGDGLFLDQCSHRLWDLRVGRDYSSVFSRLAALRNWTPCRPYVLNERAGAGAQCSTTVLCRLKACGKDAMKGGCK